MHNKMIRILFIFRIILWITAAAATCYWIAWSFELYNRGIYDVHEYSDHLRPVLTVGLIIAAASICLSFILRGVSDKIKKKIKSEILDNQ